MEKIIEIVVLILIVILGGGIFFGALAIEIASGIMEKTDENRTRKHK